MGRPANTTPRKPYKILIPVDLAAAMELRLFSDLEGRIPYGVLSNYISDLIRQDQAQHEARHG